MVGKYAVIESFSGVHIYGAEPVRDGFETFEDARTYVDEHDAWRREDRWRRWLFTCLVVGHGVIIEGCGESLEDAVEKDLIPQLEQLYGMGAEDIEIETAVYKGLLTEAEQKTLEGAQEIAHD